MEVRLRAALARKLETSSHPQIQNACLLRFQQTTRCSKEWAACQQFVRDRRVTAMEPGWYPANRYRSVSAHDETNLKNDGWFYQLNLNTHWIDGSHIYGSNNVDANNLRDPSSGKGKLKVSISDDGREMLPVASTCCPTGACDLAKSCFFAGNYIYNR